MSAWLMSEFGLLMLYMYGGTLGTEETVTERYSHRIQAWHALWAAPGKQHARAQAKACCRNDDT